MQKESLAYILKRIIVSFLVVLVSLSNSATSFSVATTPTIPEKVRIGLFFDYESKGIKSAVSRFGASCEKGIQIEYYENSSMNTLYKTFNNTTLKVRKDTYFEVIKGVINQTNQNAYHVQLGEKYSSMADANIAADELKKKGIDSYPVYSDGYYVWTGFYKDLNTANSSINEIKVKSGDAVLKVIEPSAAGIVFSGEDDKAVLLFCSETKKVQISPGIKDQKTFLKLNGDTNSRYRGSLEIRRFEKSDMTVINVVSLEEYLYGVIPYEIGASSPAEALKAQAVAARTYTLNNLKKYESLDFDLCNTVYSQVYKGVSGETTATNKAVDDSKGEVVMYNGKLASVFYFSSSGGRTEDVKNVWGSDYPYLKSVEDKYESGNSWHYNWETKITKEKILSILKTKKIDIGDLLSIKVTKYSEAGSAIEVEINGTKCSKIIKNDQCRTFFALDSQKYTISADSNIAVLSGSGNTTKIQVGGKKIISKSGISTIDPRNKEISILGCDNIKKTISATSTEYTFTGKGWGHSVGMSQEGARGMALNGFTYLKILEHYFTGAKVQKI